MTIRNAYLTPHPPLIIPSIGRGQERGVEKTIQSMRRISREIEEIEPETIIVITPHGPLFSDGIAILYEETLEGDFARFGERQYHYSRTCDRVLIDGIVEVMTTHHGLNGALIDAEMADYYGTSEKVDHGALVPLYFIDEHYTAYNLVVITYGLMSAQDLYRVGMSIREAVERAGREVVLIASGDLSHRLKDSGPYDYNPSGPVFDRLIMEDLVGNKVLEVVGMDRQLCEEAGECGKRSVDILLGALDGWDYNAELLSYEGPFGVGYGVCAFRELQPNGISLLPAIQQARRSQVAAAKGAEDHYVQLAREAIETYVRKGESIKFKHTRFYDEGELRAERKGAFVSIKDSGGLRGCIGTFLPTMDCLGDEIVHNAIQAATRDPRFAAIDEEELDDLTLTVDVLDKPVSIESEEELDPKRYGVIVTSGFRRGLLLPDLKGVDTVEEQLRIACNKAGIKEDEEVTMQRFTVQRHR